MINNVPWVNEGGGGGGGGGGVHYCSHTCNYIQHQFPVIKPFVEKLPVNVFRKGLIIGLVYFFIQLQQKTSQIPLVNAST